MTQIYLTTALAALVLLPLLALLLRAFGPRWFNGWWACASMAVVGWVLVNVSIYFSFEQACETMATYGANPPQNITDACTVDGAARVSGVLLGGFYALIFYAPFALVYEIARWMQRLHRKKRAPDFIPTN